MLKKWYMIVNPFSEIVGSQNYAIWTVKKSYRLVWKGQGVDAVAKEKNFENRLKDYLKKYGCYFLKYWAGAAYTKSGIPDLLVSSDGWFLGIEVKADNGEPTLLQLHNLNKIRESGGYGILLYPKDFELFKRFNANKSKTDAWYLSNLEEQEHWKIKLLSK